MAIRSRWGKFGAVLYLALIHLMALFFVLDIIKDRAKEDTSASVRTSLPLVSATVAEEQATDNRSLMIPVAGVKREDLQDTYTQSRSGGRSHNAMDIMAPEGTPVLAAADGEIAKFFDSELGGITIYQWSMDKQLVYYYAHLQRRAEGIAEKALVKRGAVIGYVGNTGDAGPGNYHLHFGISVPSKAGQHWGGTDVNPYPLLKDGIEPPARE